MIFNPLNSGKVLMVIYEVAIRVEEKNYEPFVSWLTEEHIGEVLKHQGFVKAEVLLEPKGHKSLRVLYYVHTEDDLENYLNHHAMAVRAKTANRWPEGIHTERSVWALYGTLNNQKT